MKFKAAIIQTNTPNDIYLARDELAELIKNAAFDGANLIATPEGCNILEREPNNFKKNVPKINSETDTLFYSNLAKELGIELLIGSFVFQIEGQKAVNRSHFFDKNGKLRAHYDKIHLFDVNLGNGLELQESKNYQAGDKVIIVQSDFAKIGLSICYDIRFAHLYRLLCQNGAQILSIPAAFTVPTGRAHWEILLRARAIENGAFVIAPAQCGTHKDGRQTYGNSMIINPWGEIIAHIKDDKPSYQIIDIDLDEVIEARKKIPAWNLNKNFDLS